MICPICHQPLERVGRTFRCGSGHAFDVAREGYVNLLLLRRKPKILGDSKEMLTARRAFFDAHHYRPLADAICEMVTSFIAQPGMSQKNMLDVGCGEGYFIGQLAIQLQREYPETSIEYCGIDISKEATKLAAKRYPQIQFAVADLNRQIPMGDGTVEVLLDIFAPRNPAEFARVLAPKGLLLIVIPTEDHLAEVRTKFNLLEIQSDKEQRILEQFSRLMQPLPTRKAHTTIQLDNRALNNLVRMTPNYWHLTDDALRALDEIEQFETTVSFELLGFRK